MTTRNHFTGQTGANIDHKSKHFDEAPSLFAENETIKVINVVSRSAYIGGTRLDEFYLRWFNIKGFDATLPTSIMLFFNHLN